MKKLFILFSFPPCGSMHWLSWDFNFLMLQMEHKMLTTLWLLSLGYRNEAVAGNTPPLLLLLFLTHFSRITWAYTADFLLGYRGKNRLNQTTVETRFCFLSCFFFSSQVSATTLNASKWIPVHTNCEELGLFHSCVTAEMLAAFLLSGHSKETWRNLPTCWHGSLWLLAPAKTIPGL